MNGAARTKKLPAECEQAKNFSFTSAKKNFLLSVLFPSPRPPRQPTPFKTLALMPSLVSLSPNPSTTAYRFRKLIGEKRKRQSSTLRHPARGEFICVRGEGGKVSSRFFGKKPETKRKIARATSDEQQNINNGRIMSRRRNFNVAPRI